MDKISKKADSLAIKAAEQTGFNKYGDLPQSSPMFSLYKQILEIAKLAATTELRQNKPEEDALKSAIEVIKRSMK